MTNSLRSWGPEPWRKSLVMQSLKANETSVVKLGLEELYSRKEVTFGEKVEGVLSLNEIDKVINRGMGRRRWMSSPIYSIVDNKYHAADDSGRWLQACSISSYICMGMQNFSREASLGRRKPEQSHRRSWTNGKVESQWEKKECRWREEGLESWTKKSGL